MRVRKFQKGDAKEVSQIMRAAFRSFLAERFTKDHENRFAPSVLARRSLGKSRFCETVSFVAVAGQHVVGYIKVTSDRNGLGRLEVIGVDCEYFGKGVGSLLMKAAERFWIRKKQRKISTCVSAGNERALIYYIKHGFVPEGYCRDHFASGVDEIILGRFL
jgi:ribosomal protein S18 acetylase RimI-like enzyme